MTADQARHAFDGQTFQADTVQWTLHFVGLEGEQARSAYRVFLQLDGVGEPQVFGVPPTLIVDVRVPETRSPERVIERITHLLNMGWRPAHAEVLLLED